jgi:hypothetical protein
LRLYIWDRVLRDYSFGLAFAIANSEEEARRVILASCEDYQQSELEDNLTCLRHPLDRHRTEPNRPRVIELDQPFGMAVSGGG